MQAAVEGFFGRLGIPFVPQYRFGNGHKVDIALHTPTDEVWGLLEIKPRLQADGLVLADAAEHFEQCAKYRLAAGVPCFLGPFFSQSQSYNGYVHGGTQPKTIAALSAIGGRLDVGLFFIHADTDCVHKPEFWKGFHFLLRQEIKAAHGGYSGDIWPQGAVPMVDLTTAGSRKDRTGT